LGPLVSQATATAAWTARPLQAHLTATFSHAGSMCQLPFSPPIRWHAALASVRAPRRRDSRASPRPNIRCRALSLAATCLCALLLAPGHPFLLYSAPHHLVALLRATGCRCRGIAPSPLGQEARGQGHRPTAQPPSSPAPRAPLKARLTYGACAPLVPATVSIAHVHVPAPS
jgi:hypothetical protein